MHSTRIKWFVVCLGLACLMLGGGVLAGHTTATEVTYPREVGASNAVHSLPTGNTVARLMNVLRGTGADSILDNCLVCGFLSIFSKNAKSSWSSGTRPTPNLPLN